VTSASNALRVAALAFAVFASTNAAATDMPPVGPAALLVPIWFVGALIGVLFFGARILVHALEAPSIEQKLTHFAAIASFALTPVPWRDDYALSGIPWIVKIVSPWAAGDEFGPVMFACALTCAAAWSILAVAGKFRFFDDATSGTQRP